MKTWLREFGQAKFQIIYALIWATAIILIDRIVDKTGGGVSYTLWLAVGYVLINGALTATVFGTSETEK